MPPAVARELSISYGGFAVGGTETNRLLTGRHRLTRTYEQSSLTFEAVVTGATEADFMSECALFEAAFRTPWQALVVTLGAVNLLSVSHTGNTGFNAIPSATKTGTGFDTGRSRLYEVTISFTEPANLTGQNGRRSSTVDQNYDASRKRTVTISGAYTALGGNSARAQYDSASPAYFTAVLGGLGGTFEKVSESAQADDANKELSFSVVYEEVIFNQSAGVLDHPAIVQPRISVSFSRSSPGDSPSSFGPVKRLATVTASFESSVDISVTSDLKGLYENTVKPYLATLARNVAGSASVALVDENFNINHAFNQISASLTFLAASSLLNLEYEMSAEVTDDFGRRKVPVWNGKKYAKWVVQNPGTRKRIVSERILTFGNIEVISPTGQQTIDILGLGALALLNFPPDGGTTGWVTDLGSIKSTPRTIGDGTTFDVTEIVSRFEQEWVEAPEGGGTATPGGGGSSGFQDVAT